MGILNSTIRFLGGKTKEDEEDESGLINPYPVLTRRQNNNNYYYYYSRSNGEYSSRTTATTTFERLRKILSINKFIYNASKKLLQKLRNIFYLQRKPAAEPILPVKDPTPRISSNDPLLVQTLLISSPRTDHLNADDHEEFPNDNSVVVPCQQWVPEETNNNSSDNYVMQMDDVIISIPDFTHSDNYVNSTIVPVVVDEGRWIKHYNIRHGILVVGDGDFSFSASLAVAFGCASHMIATSLDSKAFLKKNYKKFVSNIGELRSRGCKVMHGIDATTMATHALLGRLTFDRIVYNFPFAGFFNDLSLKAQIRPHRRLVSQFLKNAKEMITENGEIHISHKTNGRFHAWKLESLASSHCLRLIEAIDFNHIDYPGYNTKYGFGGDKNFNCYPSKTYKFGL